MKRFWLIALVALFAVVFVGCSPTDMAEMQQAKQLRQAKYTSEAAIARTHLETAEQNFDVRRRVVLYNVRLGETICVIEGYCAVTIDSDGDINVTRKEGKDKYAKDYLRCSQDVIYYSEALEAELEPTYKYTVTYNPRLWLPEVVIQR